MRAIVLSAAALIVVIASAIPSVSMPAKPGTVTLFEVPVVPLTEKFDQAVNRWIDELSKQEVYREWKQAKWRREPLGPGLHGWIVLLTSAAGDRNIGYLIVNVNPEGDFILTEYGNGEYMTFTSAAAIA